MRRARVKAEGRAFYHVMSRCALQQHLLTGDVKGMFLRILRRAEYFSGVKIVNYCVMDNHFHLLLEVPERQEVDDASLDDRIMVLYGAQKAGRIFKRWKVLKDAGSANVVEKERDAFRKRMFDLSEFMKTFKQRFSLWYCSNHGNIEGTIWQGPFHSVLVEGEHDALAAISAYITLNPVRAGIAEDAGAYAWSGYGAAANGDRAAKAALLFTYGGNAAIAAKWKAYQSMVAAAAAKRVESPPSDEMHRAGEAYSRHVECGGNSVISTGGQGSDDQIATAEDGENEHGQIRSLNVLRRRDKKISRGVAFGTKSFVTVAIRRASQTEEVLTYPQPFCLGERRTPLYCAGRRGA